MPMDRGYGKGTAKGDGARQSEHKFSQIARAEIPRSQFDRSCGHKTSFDGGLLVPIFVDETLPGDTFNLKMSSFARLATPLFPILDNMYMDFFFFAVPYRLIWNNFQKFMGEQTDPGDSTDFLTPKTGTFINTSVFTYHYMGVPLAEGNSITVNNLPGRAYNLIWNEWFRDENLQDSLTIELDDGPDNSANYRDLQRRGKRHDYFTSCLPFAQKGTAVELPLGSTAPVVATGDSIPLFDGSGWAGATSLEANATGVGVDWAAAPGSATAAAWDDPKLEADLSGATAATINDIRQAFQIQKLLERDARGGSRYTEIVRSHFGVTSPDERLQRPEYLGGGSTRINIHAVSATSGDANAPEVGTLSAFGTQMSHGIGFTKSFTEHCVIIGLVSVRADLTYQQGLNRMWSRSTRFDYYWPAFSHLGEQAVLNKEIYMDASANDDLVFGFQERYAEYRYKPSWVSGVLNSKASGTLDSWHLGLEFTSLPLLNDVFIEDNPPIDRVIAIPSQPHFIGDFYFDYKCARPMPTYSIPGLVDHF